MHVLIAEARPSTRAALRALLEHDPHCHRISEATDAQGTLAALSDAPDPVSYTHLTLPTSDLV